ncbi:MAG: aldo/keto reductase, partial [Dehalococcoidales bacterium]|nr:aldo/keto reductase [Dehalococcoidales bacterium]
MEYRNLGSLKASVLGIGGLHFGNLCDQATTTRIIHQALDTGINFIDTAPMYGNGYSEGYIGNAIRGYRHDVLIATKVGLEPKITRDGTDGVSVVPLDEKNIRSSVDKSLRALGTDYIDLYQVHAFDPNTPVEATMATLDALVKEGKIRLIGCSNYLRGEIELASAAEAKNGWTQFVSFQTHYNLIERRAEQEVIPSCHALGVGIICNRALARGILTGKYKPSQPLPEGSRAVTSYRIRRWLSEGTLRLVAALDEWAQKHSRTVIELAIAWLLAKPDVSVVLVGVRDIHQLEINVR